MEIRAQLNDESYTPEGKQRLCFTLEHKVDTADLNGKDIRLIVKEWKDKRSLQANRLMWSCIGKIAKAINSDKDSVHDIELKRYGVFTYQLFIPEAVDTFIRAWEGVCEKKGLVSVNGKDAEQVLVVYPSRVYDTREFHHLLEGIISDMKDMGLQTPEEERIEMAMKEYEEAKPWQAKAS